MKEKCDACNGEGQYEANVLSTKGEFREDVPLICGLCDGTGEVEA